MESRKGCPACEHTDPELEREIQALAQLLFDAYLLNPMNADAHTSPSIDDLDKPL
jgi:hypothetical protein